MDGQLCRHSTAATVEIRIISTTFLLVTVSALVQRWQQGDAEHQRSHLLLLLCFSGKIIKIILQPTAQAVLCCIAPCLLQIFHSQSVQSVFQKRLLLLPFLSLNRIAVKIKTRLVAGHTL